MLGFLFTRRPRAVRLALPHGTAASARGGRCETAMGGAGRLSFLERHPGVDVVWRMGLGAALGLGLGLGVILGGDAITGRSVASYSGPLPPPTPIWNAPMPMGMAGPTAPLPFLPVGQLATGTR